MTEIALTTAQLPTLQPGELERWLLSAAAVGAIALMWQKLAARKNGNGNCHANGGTYVKREEYHQDRARVENEINLLRDRIDSRHLALIERLELLQAGLVSEAERRDASLHRRLATIETGLARLDERTGRERAKAES